MTDNGVSGDEGYILCNLDVVNPCGAKRETFIERARPAFDSLIAKGFIEPVYIMTDAGRAALEEFTETKLSQLGRSHGEDQKP